jgi:hypothetical protein
MIMLLLKIEAKTLDDEILNSFLTRMKRKSLTRVRCDIYKYLIIISIKNN